MPEATTEEKKREDEVKTQGEKVKILAAYMGADSGAYKPGLKDAVAAADAIIHCDFVPRDKQEIATSSALRIAEDFAAAINNREKPKEAEDVLKLFDSVAKIVRRAGGDLVYFSGNVGGWRWHASEETLASLATIANKMAGMEQSCMETLELATLIASLVAANKNSSENSIMLALEVSRAAAARKGITDGIRLKIKWIEEKVGVGK